MKNNSQNSLVLKPEFAIAYRGKMFEVVTWEGKPGITFEAAVRSPGVRVLIETEKDGHLALVMTRELRREANGWDYRLPGGKVFDTLTELDEARTRGMNIAECALNAAQREGREEAGVTGGTVTPLDVSHAGASVEWDLHYFLLQGAEIGEQELDNSEQGDIEVVILSAQEIFEKLVNREIQEDRSANMLWLWLARNGIVKVEK